MGNRATAQEAKQYEDLRSKVEQDLNAQSGYWGTQAGQYQWHVVGEIKQHQLATT